MIGEIEQTFRLSWRTNHAYVPDKAKIAFVRQIMLAKDDIDDQHPIWLQFWFKEWRVGGNFEMRPLWHEKDVVLEQSLLFFVENSWGHHKRAFKETWKLQTELEMEHVKGGIADRMVLTHAMRPLVPTIWERL